MVGFEGEGMLKVVSEVGKLHDHDFGDIITVDCTCLLKKTFIVFAWWKQMQYLNLSSSLSILGNILVPASPSFFCPKDLTSSKFLGGCATYENEDLKTHRSDRFEEIPFFNKSSQIF